MVPLKKGERMKGPLAMVTGVPKEHCIRKCMMESACDGIGVDSLHKYCIMYGIDIKHPPTYYKHCDGNYEL
jgi:hypothetical protein